VINVTTSILSPAALVGYEATLFDCQDNKAVLCALKMCDKHEFLVQC
jgi:hypothetical protein